MPLTIDPDTGIPVSPVKEAMNALQLSVADLANMTRLSNSTITYTTQCLFPNPNYQLIKIFSEVNPNFLDDYHNYQIYRRLNSSIPILLWEKGAATDPLRLPESFPEVPEINPHIEFREFILEATMDEYCEELCLERYLVQYMETKESPKTTFSSSLRSILIMAMGSTATDQLVKAWKDWNHDRLKSQEPVVYASYNPALVRSENSLVPPMGSK